MMESDKLTARLATLSPARRALLELKLQQGRAGITGNMCIPRRANRDSAPVSFGQQRLWFLSQLEAESSAYNERSAFRLDGHLDIAALRGALNAIVERHEVLRTTYGLTDGGEPVQRIGAAVDIDLPVIDISEVAESQRDDEVQRIAAELRERPFDLSRDMPLRLALIRLSPSSHVFVEVKHHIASDGWSSGVFSRELAALYNSLSQGRPNPLSELPIQYADYSLWQREWLQGEVLGKQLAYWKGQLKDIPVLELPTDRPRSASANHAGAKKILTLSETLTNRLKALSQQEGATLFMTLLTAFHVLLYRYTGQDDITVGSPIAGRTRSETEGLIGFFVNTLVLRSKLAGKPTFKELLARVRETSLQAYEHQDVPFEKLVEEIKPARDQHQTPFFQVMFAVQNVPRSQLAMPGLKVTPVDIDSSTAKFDIFAAFIEREREMMLRIEYNTELFDPATIERMLGHMQTLLEGIVANPDRSIETLPILPAVERQRLLIDWNDTKREFPDGRCIHELFEARVNQNPEAVALVFENEQWTYRELNCRANQLARYLRGRGVGRETLVALCLERSMEMVVALLAILKAGGAYVPMDPEYPRDRLEFMLRDTQAPVLVTQERLSQILPAFEGERVCLDRDRDRIVRESEENLGSDASADSLAYVIYTSGSTGKPKGVMIQQGSVVNFLTSMASEPGMTNQDTLLAVTTLSFDIAGLEIYLPLSVGGRVVMVSRDVAVDGFRLAKQLSDCGATIMQATPATWRMLLASGWQGNQRLKILCGGEALPGELADQLVRRSAALWNMYGPTETTIWSALQRVPADNGKISLGRPIANTKTYILDQQLQLVPIGVAGELYLGGDGLARGYLNRPELSAEKFIADPFSSEPGARLYRTGDLTRHLADGNIEFLGRIDNQVKIRGYRIELGEIEAVLSQHPAVYECAVAVHEDAASDPRLVAYLVSSTESKPTVDELRNFTKETLPQFMVPAAFFFLTSLPLTPNGKLDRKALPQPDLDPQAKIIGYVAPRTAVEQLLAVIWAEVLKVDRVGIDDNFFDLGGHSLMAVRLVAEVAKRLGHTIPVALLFEKPTIAQLASALHPHTQDLSSPVIAVQSKGSKPPLFCVHGYNAYLHVARELGVDRPFYGLGQHFTGREVVRIEVEEQANDNLKEVYAIQPEGPYYLAGHSFGGLVAYEMARLLQNDGHEVAFLGLIDTGFPKQPKPALSRLRHGLLDYWYTLCRLSPADRIRYIFQSIKAAAQWRLKSLLCYCYHCMDKKLPPDLLVFYIDAILFDRQYMKARRRYRPRAYRGLIHIFKAEDSASNTEEWNAMTNRNLVTHEIAGSHLTIIEEPAVFELARSLKSCLEQTATGPQPAAHIPAYTNGSAHALQALAFQRSTIRR